MTVRTDRRGFLGLAAAAGAALAVGFDAQGALAAGAADAPGAAFNPFVRIAPDGAVTVIAKHFEMGQGASTGLATLVAEELGADWAQMRVAFAPADPSRYANLLFGTQGTGGSTAMANSWLQYRKAGAAAREMILRAAAARWGVDPAELDIVEGQVRGAGRSAGLGEFAADAAALTPPAEPALKPASAFRLIGAPDLRRLDGPSKTDGTAEFAMDVKVPGMVWAVILRSPRHGARLTGFDAAGAQAVRGFVDARALPNGAGVAVYARSTWAAIKAREAIEASWDEAEAETRSTDRMEAEHLALLDAPTYQARGEAAQAAAALSGAARVVEADMLLPHLAHAPMEPLNCVIEPLEDGVLIHDGCQFPGLTQPIVAAVLGLRPEQVRIRTVFAGGSFGRRANPTSDYHVEAALAFAALGGKTPVKLVWTREDDLAGGYYRPMAAHRVRVGLDADGRVVGWDHRIAAQSIMKGTAFESVTVHDGVDHSSVEGAADTPYAIPAMSVGLSDWTSPIPVLWWRSVGHSHTAFAMETALDMAAEAAGRDPLELRLELLSGESDDHRRLSGVLRLAAEKAGWGAPLAAGRGRGLAAHKSFGSYVATVVEVTARDGRVRIDRVVCAVDCGTAINPDIVRAQVEGAVGFGIGHAMRNRITFDNGAVEQTNFPDYEPLRMGDIGAIEVHVAPSEAPPSGIGEPGTPPAAPALANAIAAATGVRPLKLPITRAGLSFA
ncbi:xanthine dehydrogenase family protein molybdopterin-binding subunit [Oceanicella actignis]|uniref:Isoquinoline 1-oxidoreductase, beta subunit n=1 Tax=Oceanicella actignis TaxID=1189325 RepID=A0A1M7SV57_9RHOB|nr:xanthine dehydrogenase family protein molybdopterin-binding subunit [Oceanicella actignis]SES72670.1 isoquinoline 1-oxidoreductase, beta subunit [Oceanicella actignis]SHN62437.1 isoquinoline 1-oxidoreductase, beta subunit [Oceanicella actignis]